MLDQGGHVVGVAVDVVRGRAPRVIALPVPTVIEQHAAEILGQRAGITGGPPQVCVAPGTEVKNQRRAFALDLVVEAHAVVPGKDWHGGIVLGRASIGPGMSAPCPRIELDFDRRETLQGGRRQDGR